MSEQPDGDVRITQLPTDVIDRIRAAASRNGVLDSAAGACRWALVQFANNLDPSTAEPLPVEAKKSA